MEIFTLSPESKDKILQLMTEEGFSPETHFLRVSVKGGGCSGLSYDLSFDDKEQEGDKSSISEGIKVVVDKKSLLYVFGTQLEFSDGLNGKGFNFANPNASRTCACGESFSI